MQCIVCPSLNRRRSGVSPLQRLSRKFLAVVCFMPLRIINVLTVIYPLKMLLRRASISSSCPCTRLGFVNRSSLRKPSLEQSESVTNCLAGMNSMPAYIRSFPVTRSGSLWSPRRRILGAKVPKGVSTRWPLLSHMAHTLQATSRAFSTSCLVIPRQSAQNSSSPLVLCFIVMTGSAQSRGFPSSSFVGRGYSSQRTPFVFLGIVYDV